jgi:hypothetical protein
MSKISLIRLNQELKAENAKLKQEQKNFENHLNLDNKRLYDERDALKQENAELRKLLRQQHELISEVVPGVHDDSNIPMKVPCKVCEALTRPTEVKS